MGNLTEQIIEILRLDARIGAEEISQRLCCPVAQIKEEIARLEKDNVIRGYTVILNNNAIASSKVRALIEVRVAPNRDGGFNPVAKRIARFTEVENLFLLSGGFDLLVEVAGDSLQEVAAFVAEKLATIDGVLSTSTSFLLKKYKESGKAMEDDEEYERLKVSP